MGYQSRRPIIATIATVFAAMAILAAAFLVWWQHIIHLESIADLETRILPVDAIKLESIRQRSLTMAEVGGLIGEPRYKSKSVRGLEVWNYVDCSVDPYGKHHIAVHLEFGSDNRIADVRLSSFGCS